MQFSQPQKISIPRQNDLLLVVEISVIVECGKFSITRREFERFVAKVELALLEGHEARGGKEAGSGLAEHLNKKL